MFRKSDKILCITSQNSSDDDIIALSKDVNNKITDLDIFAFSPSIEAGYNISVEHFDVMYCIFVNKNVSMFGNLQQLNRVRHKKDNAVHIYCRKDAFYRKPQQVIKHYMNKSKEIKEKQRSSAESISK